MDENTTLIRMCYRASDVVIAAQYNQTDVWQQIHTYTKHPSWLQQVYRTLHATDQFNACLHDVTAEAPASHWVPYCEATITTLAMCAPYDWIHLVCTHPDSAIENWIRQTAVHVAPMGQRINGMNQPANKQYANYLLNRDSQFISGAYFAHDGTMIRNGSIMSERILANRFHSKSQRTSSPQQAFPVS
jgi:hypothetical protein